MNKIKSLSFPFFSFLIVSFFPPNSILLYISSLNLPGQQALAKCIKLTKENIKDQCAIKVKRNDLAKKLKEKKRCNFPIPPFLKIIFVIV
jgi:hypothetical protein